MNPPRQVSDITSQLCNAVLEIKIEPKKVEKKRLLTEEEKFQKEDIVVPKIPVKEDNIFGSIQIRESAKERDKHLEDLLNPDLLALKNVTFTKYNKNKFKRGLDKDEKPFPVSPRIAPYEFNNPVPAAKNYYWCSCGMSRTQPFCDNSHMGTKFKPLKFRVEEDTTSLQLCG